MSPPPSSPSPDIARLVAEGYEVTVGQASLTVHWVPFVDEQRGVRRGELVVPLWRRNGRIVPPMGHSAQFVGGRPCDAAGRELPLGGIVNSDDGRRYLCIRPEGREFGDYHELVTAYVRRIEEPAQAIRPSASARRMRGKVHAPPRSPLEYGDPSQVRDAVDGYAERVAGGSVGIVGLGGTGSYVLDLVAKTGVEHVHVFDDDEFQQHNAFRAPGAATRAEAEAGRSKVDHFADIYSRMHSGIVPHRTAIGQDNVALLDLVDFAFLCLDEPHAKPAIIARLERNGTPFVDCGIGLQPTPEGLIGMIRVTTSTPDMRSHVHAGGRISFCGGPDDDPYAFRAQVAELNALNAALAVIRWKRLKGFYAGARGEHHSAFVIDDNQMINGDADGGME